MVHFFKNTAIVLVNNYENFPNVLVVFHINNRRDVLQRGKHTHSDNNFDLKKGTLKNDCLNMKCTTQVGSNSFCELKLSTVTPQIQYLRL